MYTCTEFLFEENKIIQLLPHFITRRCGVLYGSPNFHRIDSLEEISSPEEWISYEASIP
jgi:hypothetical protein